MVNEVQGPGAAVEESTQASGSTGPTVTATPVNPLLGAGSRL